MHYLIFLPELIIEIDLILDAQPILAQVLASRRLVQGFTKNKRNLGSKTQ